APSPASAFAKSVFTGSFVTGIFSPLLLMPLIKDLVGDSVLVYMAEIVGEPAEDHRLVDIITDPRLDWVGPEPRGIASVITPTAGGVYTIVEDTEDVTTQNNNIID
ncbi:hypothetical protein A2U01_0041500, partial [Trifolium medium]|nr:hypothetical protein [Trifolium medium]